MDLNNLENEVARAVENRICERGNRYRNLSGHPPEPAKSPEQERFDLVMKVLKPQAEREAEARAAEEQARAEAEHLALNGAGLLRKALGGATGTVNGASVDSAAEVLRQVVNSRMDATG